MKNLAIIPARSGSKRLKDKNIKLLAGKPLIAYSIEAAINSKVFEEIVVSTDSPIYAKIATEYSASVPFLRRKDLATDNAVTLDAAREVIAWFKAEQRFFDTIAILQPTSPLRTREDIIAGYRLMEEKSADAIISVCHAEHSPLWSNTLPENHCLQGFIDKSIYNLQGQELPEYYRLNGALYIIKVDAIMNKADIYTEKSFAYIMPRERSIDIDEELDFFIAEKIMERSF